MGEVPSGGWMLCGMCLDIICLAILVRQYQSIWSLTKNYPHWLINLGFIGGGCFLYLARLAIHHLIQSPLSKGQSIIVKDKPYAIGRTHLLSISIVDLKGHPMGLIWVLDYGISRFHVCKMWKCHSTLIPWMVDLTFLSMAILPTAIIGRAFADLLSIFIKAAINCFIYVVLLLSAQIGVLALLWPDAKVSTGNMEKQCLYQGLFVRLAMASDDYVNITLNASSQLEFIKRTGRFGPYL